MIFVVDFCLTNSYRQVINLQIVPTDKLRSYPWGIADKTVLKERRSVSPHFFLSHTGRTQKVTDCIQLKIS